MVKVRVLILEDEQPAAQRLTQLLKNLRPNFEVVRVIQAGSEAVEHLRTHELPHLIISDVELADGLCFDVFAEVEVQVPVIFTTAYNEYAIRAFETHAIDYLLKPVHKEKLKRALIKFEKQTSPPSIHWAALDKLLRQKKDSQRYIVKYGQKMVVLKRKDIAYFYSMEKSTFAVDINGKTYPMDESLSALENELPDRNFFRINRNMLVHIDSLHEMRPHSKGRIRLLLKPEHFNRSHTIVSVERTPDFRKWLRAE